MTFTAKDARDLLIQTEQYDKIIEIVKKDAVSYRSTHINADIEDATRLRLEEDGFTLHPTYDKDGYYLSWSEPKTSFVKVETVKEIVPKSRYIAYLFGGISIGCAISFLLHLLS